MIKDVSYFLPSSFPENRNGVLLIHGLTGTPTEMRIIAKGLNKAGFSVYAMQLAGHCGNEDDLNQTTWQDWVKSVEEAAEFLLTKVDHLFVGGLSMGALLSLNLAATFPDKVKGIAAYGPTFHYDGWSMPFTAKYLFFLVKWFKKLGIFQNRVFVERPPYGLKDERIRASISESMNSGDSTEAGLAGNPYPAVAEMQWLIKSVKKQLPNVISPCLIMHALEDDIANINTNGRFVEKNVSGPTKFIELNDSYHMVTIDRQRKMVIKETIDFFNKISDELSFKQSPSFSKKD